MFCHDRLNIVYAQFTLLIFYILSLGGPAEQGLYHWTRKGGVERLPGSYKTTNSVAYDYKRNCLYHLDGCEQTLRKFKFNPKTGKCCKTNDAITIFSIDNLLFYSCNFQRNQKFCGEILVFQTRVLPLDFLLIT